MKKNGNYNISKNETYYAVFGGKLTAFKFLEYVHDFKSGVTHLKLNVAQKGIVEYDMEHESEDMKVWGFKYYMSIDDYMRGLSQTAWTFERQVIGNSDINEVYCMKFMNAMRKYPSIVMTYDRMYNSWGNHLYYKVYHNSNGVYESKACVTSFINGKYDMLDNVCYGDFSTKGYFTYENCYKATLPKVVEFDDEQIVEEEKEYTIEIKVKGKSLEDAKSKISIK